MSAPCKVLFYPAPVGPYPYGLSEVHARCETHGMVMPTPCGPDDLCPIGKIERAVDEGLAKIAAQIGMTG